MHMLQFLLLNHSLELKCNRWLTLHVFLYRENGLFTQTLRKVKRDTKKSILELLYPWMGVMRTWLTYKFASSIRLLWLCRSKQSLLEYAFTRIILVTFLNLLNSLVVCWSKIFICTCLIFKSREFRKWTLKRKSNLSSECYCDSYLLHLRSTKYSACIMLQEWI